MVWDTEFAPNPHYGVLTLATCKPRIRKYAQIGDWISGWTAVKVYGKDHRPHYFDEERLIYLARVTQIIPFVQYWYDYRDKQPKVLSDGKNKSQKGCGKTRSEVGEVLYDSGDNIYRPNKNDSYGFTQLPNGGNHTDKDKKRDLSGENVLVCDEFYYFGVSNAYAVNKDVYFPYKVPRWKKVELEKVEQLIQLIRKESKKGVVTIYKNK